MRQTYSSQCALYNYHNISRFFCSSHACMVPQGPVKMLHPVFTRVLPRISKVVKNSTIVLICLGIVGIKFAQMICIHLRLMEERKPED